MEERRREDREREGAESPGEAKVAPRRNLQRLAPTLVEAAPPTGSLDGLPTIQGKPKWPPRNVCNDGCRPSRRRGGTRGGGKRCEGTSGERKSGGGHRLARGSHGSPLKKTATIGTTLVEAAPPKESQDGLHTPQGRPGWSPTKICNDWYRPSRRHGGMSGMRVGTDKGRGRIHRTKRFSELACARTRMFTQRGMRTQEGGRSSLGFPECPASAEPTHPFTHAAPWESQGRGTAMAATEE